MQSNKLIAETVIITREDIRNQAIWDALVDIIMNNGTIDAIKKVTQDQEITITPCELDNKHIEGYNVPPMPSKEEAHLNRIGFNAMYEAELRMENKKE